MKRKLNQLLALSATLGATSLTGDAKEVFEPSIINVFNSISHGPYKRPKSKGSTAWKQRINNFKKT